MRNNPRWLHGFVLRATCEREQGWERCFIGDFLRNKQWVYLPKVKVIQILFISKNFIPFLSEISPNTIQMRRFGVSEGGCGRCSRGEFAVLRLFRGEGRKRSQPVPRGADFAVRGRCGCMTGVCDGQERLRFAKGGVHFALRGLRVYSNRKRFQVSGRSLRRARTKRSGLRASAAGRLRPARHLWCRFFPRFSCAPPSIWS